MSDIGKFIIIVLVCICQLLSGCNGNNGQMVGPLPEFSTDTNYTSSHRRIPTSTHGRVGRVDDFRWEQTRNSNEFIHIGDFKATDNASLPAYKIRYSQDKMAIQIYAQACAQKEWDQKLAEYALGSPLIGIITCSFSPDELYFEFIIEFTSPVRYRTWYYQDQGYFTIELSPQ
ncbi:MAG: hypothetical protein FH749_07560 [Firmicutes bacterium]|nr:hypothetical protein [Bacillota bacterium]